MSKPKKINAIQDDLFRNRLTNQLNPKHPLFILANLIDWDSLDVHLSSYYESEVGHPPKPTRLMAGLMMLQHMEALSDEMVVQKWVENPYWQAFCGYDFFQWEFPIHPTSLTRWRARLGTDGIDKILACTIQTAVVSGAVNEKSFETVIADTTVQEKAITFPTDGKLLNRARIQLVDLAKKVGIDLRQSYTRVGRYALIQVARYGHARQFKRMRKSIKKLKVYLGRVTRDIERKINAQADLQNTFSDLLSKANRLLTQTKTSKNKLYSLHAPEVECIAKGKAHKPYEFGCKVSLIATFKEGLALSAQALHGNPYDGHTLEGALDHASSLSGKLIKQAFADDGYKGHGVDPQKTQVILSRQKKLPKSLIIARKRRNAIEPIIGHMKAEGKLGRNWLKGMLGDQINALLCAVGHNMRLILNHIRIFFILLWIAIIQNQSDNRTIKIVS